MLHQPRRPLPFVAKDGSQCSGALLHSLPTDLALRRKGRLSVLMICFRWVRAKPFAPSSQSMAQPSLCGHQQQQACNTIRGVLVLAPTGLRPVTPRLVVGNGLRPFCVDSEFGLVFYSYLSIGTLNLKFRLRRPCRGFVTHSLADLCPSSQRTALSVRGLCYTSLADLCPSSQRTALSVDDLLPLG